MAFWNKKSEEKKKKDPFDSFFDDDLFGDNFAKSIKSMMEEMQKNMSSFERLDEQELRKIDPKKTMVYGFSMKMGPDGKVKMEEFGNVEPGKKPSLKNEREPITEVMEKDNTISVIAELPGVEKKDIKLDLEDSNTKLTIKVAGKFSKTVQLPEKVKQDTSKATYKNGILEVELEKADKTKKTQIKVE